MCCRFSAFLRSVYWWEEAIENQSLQGVMLCTGKMLNIIWIYLSFAIIILFFIIFLLSSSLSVVQPQLIIINCWQSAVTCLNLHCLVALPANLNLSTQQEHTAQYLTLSWNLEKLCARQTLSNSFGTTSMFSQMWTMLWCVLNPCLLWLPKQRQISSGDLVSAARLCV